jgi:molecular chaperone DnaK (HSP70)
MKIDNSCYVGMMASYGSASQSPEFPDKKRAHDAVEPAENENDYSDSKKTRRLIRNREAAKRYIFVNRNRLKKKDWIKSLQKSNEEAEETNKKLKARVAALKEEYTRLQFLVESKGSSLNLKSIY